MRMLMMAVLGLSAVAAPSVSFAGQKPAEKPSTMKAAPACAALVFRPLPSGTSDGDQIAATYKSRFARLELSGTVQNGAPENYYLPTNGKRISGGARGRRAAAGCAATKKMP